MKKALTKGYKDRYNEIIDKAGVRAVAHFPWALRDIEDLVRSSFHVLGRDDKRSITPPDQFVYRATHFQVVHPTAPIPLNGLECEVQVLMVRRKTLRPRIIGPKIKGPRKEMPKIKWFN